MQIMSSDGVKHVVLCWIAPIRDNTGQITNALVMLTDITEARQLEDHLSSLGFMIGSISHGIKGLLTSLDGGMYLTEKGFETGNKERMQEGISLTQQMASRIKKLVLDILYYTKTRKMEWGQYSVRQFMQDTSRMAEISAGKHGVKLETNVDMKAEDDIFEVDEESLQTALINILENSIEACIDNDNAQRSLISLNTRVDQTKVIFTIQDNGIGIDQDSLKNIFTIFFSSKGNKGTGLGLYIANKVIRKHRGSIKVRSKKHKGTRFIIKIPRTVPDTVRNPQGVAYPN